MYRQFGKRVFDVTAATLLIAAASPVLLAIALLVKATSRGPVFYTQQRVGKDGRPFPFIKFRSMVVGAERQGAGILCLKDDPRVTRVGKLLRRFSLDELPQLFNVLRGEMSLVGPRPGLDYQVQQYTPEQRRRLTVLPGITGWAQVNGRNSITWDERIRLDLAYVDGMSLLFDLKILARTLSAVLRSDVLIAQKDHFREAALRTRER